MPEKLIRLNTDGDSIDPIAVIVMALFYLPLHGAMLWLVAQRFGRRKISLSGREWLMYSLFLVGQVIAIAAWLRVLINNRNPVSLAYQSGAFFIFIALDIGILFSVRNILQRTELRVRNAHLEKQIDAQRDHYAAITAQYEQIRHMRHDIANHLHTTKLLLDSGKHTQAAAYAAEVAGSAMYQDLGRCENPVVDAFLFGCVEELRAKGIAITADVILPAECSVTNTDLISAFGNLLDNAAEACQATADKSMFVRARISEGHLLIEKKIPCRNPPRKKKSAAFRSWSAA